jgi:small subunit ribosomal protein S36
VSADNRTRVWAGRLADWIRQIPKIVWWITGLHVMLLLAYSILLPTYRAPDEPQHVDLANFVAEDLRYPAWDERDISPGVQRSLDYVDYFDGSAHLTTDAATPRSQRPSFEDLETPPRDTSLNQQPQHPPLYYLLAAGGGRALELVVDEPSFDLETWLYRLVSVLCVAPLPLIIWCTARRLRAPTPVGVAAMLIPLAIPQLTHIGSAVNNDSLMFLLFWLLTPVVIRLADGDLRPSTGVVAGVITGLGMFTKGFALVLPVWVLAALLVALHRGGRDKLRAATIAGALCGLCTMLIGGWWWVRNLVLYQHLSPSRMDELVPEAENVDVELGNFVQTWAYRTTRRFWGEFGWFDVHIPTLAFGLATAVCLVGLVVACTRRDRVAGTRLGDRLLLASPLLLLVGTQFAFSFRGYLLTGALPGMQGRYWFGAVSGAAVVIALGLANLRAGWLRWLPLTVLGAVVAMQAVGISTILGYYWGAPGSPVVDHVRAVIAWSPLPGELVGVGALLAAVVVSGSFVELLRLARGRSPTDAGSPPSPPRQGEEATFPAEQAPTASLQEAGT